MVQESLKINVKGNEYVINYPNVGQIQSIDIQKSVLSSGQYSILMSMTTETAALTLDKIDMQALFNVLCPEVLKDLTVSSLDDLKIVDFNYLRKIYQKEIVPWFLSVIELIREVYQ